MRNTFGLMFLAGIAACAYAGWGVWNRLESNHSASSGLGLPDYLSSVIVLMFASSLAWTILKVVQQRYPGIAESFIEDESKPAIAPRQPS